MTNDEAIAYCIENNTRITFGSIVELLIYGQEFYGDTLSDAITKYEQYLDQRVEAQRDEDEARINWPVGTKALMLVGGNETAVVVGGEAWLENTVCRIWCHAAMQPEIIISLPIRSLYKPSKEQI